MAEDIIEKQTAFAGKVTNIDDRVAVTINNDEHIAEVRLNRPDKMNALDPAMFKAIVKAADLVKNTPSVRAVVLCGEGRAFCAGLDLMSMQSGVDGGLVSDLMERTHHNSNIFQAVAMLWRQLPVPVIAAVQGVCFGGGLQIASGADVRFVTKDARCSIMEMRWGLVPDMGGYALWRGNVRDDVLRELVYTNKEISGEEGQKIGLFTHVTDDPHSEALALARTIAHKNPDAIVRAKKLSNMMQHVNEDTILMEESRLQKEVIRTPNQTEAVMAQMQKRAPKFSDGE